MTYVLDMSPSEAVANGAQLLDEKMPGWWRAISLEELRLASCRSCVCGQLASTAAVRMISGQFVNGYAKTLHMLNLSWHSGVNPEWEFDYDHGFNVKPHSMYPDMSYEEWDAVCAATFAALDVEWRKVIESRLEADRLPAPAIEREVVPA